MPSDASSRPVDRSARSRTRILDVPGAALLGLWPAVAAAALAFNVFYLRRHHRGLLSGKLSDFAINFLLPIALVSAAEWSLALLRLFRPRVEPRLGPLGIGIACLVSASYFAVLKTWPPFTHAHRALLSILDIPFGGGRSFRNLADPTDLIALVMVPLAALYLRRAAALRERPRA